MKQQYHFCLKPKKVWFIFQIYVTKIFLMRKVFFFHTVRIKGFSQYLKSHTVKPV